MVKTDPRCAGMDRVSKNQRAAEKLRWRDIAVHTCIVCVLMATHVRVCAGTHLRSCLSVGSVSVVRVETDGAKLLPDAHQTPRCVPKPLPRSLLHSIHPCLAIKDPMDLIRWLLCSSWMRENCFYPPTLSSYDVGTIAQALLFRD